MGFIGTVTEKALVGKDRPNVAVKTQRLGTGDKTAVDCQQQRGKVGRKSHGTRVGRDGRKDLYCNRLRRRSEPNFAAQQKLRPCQGKPQKRKPSVGSSLVAKDRLGVEDIGALVSYQGFPASPLCDPSRWLFDFASSLWHSLRFR